MTKPTKWLCAQRRLRSAWASAQSDQSLRCPKLGSLSTHWAHSEDSDQTGRIFLESRQLKKQCPEQTSRDSRQNPRKKCRDGLFVKKFCIWGNRCWQCLLLFQSTYVRAVKYRKLFIFSVKILNTKQNQRS